MLGVVGSDGKRMPPFFFKEGLKITTDVYIRVMSRVVKPWIDENYPNGNVIWQQDSAPAHAATRTQKWLKERLPDFWPKDLWPPNSPDANPLDYGIWGYIEKKVCKTPHRNVDSLKSAICEEWAAMSDEYVAKVCGSFRRRIEAIIEADGGHFERKRKIRS